MNFGVGRVFGSEDALGEAGDGELFGAAFFKLDEALEVGILVRGVDLIGTPLTAFAKIIATGDKKDVFNGVCGAESGGVPVSASSPPLLVSEVEVQKKATSQDAGPILGAPRKKLRRITK